MGGPYMLPGHYALRPDRSSAYTQAMGTTSAAVHQVLHKENGGLGDVSGEVPSRHRVLLRSAASTKSSSVGVVCATEYTDIDSLSSRLWSVGLASFSDSGCNVTKILTVLSLVHAVGEARSPTPWWKLLLSYIGSLLEPTMLWN
ncbi:hypothetical protein OPT61_g1550 [Boeremia exigua]|uniref:Uncharacterized protein n=1 Tax=Boeremia exigua TaxID=749465 RepID=A0ACC2IPR4_9PLEO|nr:hypothetical protein OPT61_g1550 [Boeremia exigua]